MEESRETRPRRSFGECMADFDKLEHQTYGKFTAELSSLKGLFNNLTFTLLEVSSQQAIVLTGQTCYEMFVEARNPLATESSTANYGILPAFNAKVTGAMKDKVLRTYSRVLDLEKETDTLLDNIRDELAEQVLSTMEMMWAKRSAQSEKELEEKDSQEEKWSEVMENLRNEKNMIAAAEGSIAEREKALENRSRELEKGYHTKVQKSVEERLREEKTKLADRLSTAEAKALQYAKVVHKNEVLEAKISQGDLEKKLLKYKDRDDEANALREGYDQLSNDIQVLQTEKSELQVDIDELKREQERLPKEYQSSSEPGHVDQPAASSPRPSATTPLDRQTAELQHLGALRAVWQTALDNATIKTKDSTNKKEARREKIREAEQQLQKSKPAPKSKPHRGSGIQSTPKNPRIQEQVVSNGTSNGQEELQSSAGTLGTLQKPRVAPEAFPVLSSPAGKKATQPKAWKSLRLVDVPKEQPSGAQKRSG
ncbi:hypothetical protein G6011_09225 [Alternaria panax]|uniref:Uncharacterized protein n=1 Tax=Alternaria panax TaxID=48097 RepID=A0AAD4NNV6_9PLEO|nr:hypothetical protein G6011_09225 [Alternaria panax]